MLLFLLFAGYRGATSLLLNEVSASSSFDDVCPGFRAFVLIAERVCFSAAVEEARDSATSFSSLMQNIRHARHNCDRGTTAVGNYATHIQQRP